MILIISDKLYFDKSLILIKSIRLIHSTLPIHYHQINFNNKIDIQNIEYSYSNLQLDESKKYKFNDTYYSQKQAYCANIRFKIIKDILNKYNYILYLDADSIVTQPLSNLIEICQNNDLVINKCTKKKYYRKGFRLRTGVFSIRNNEIMHQFLNNCLKQINLYQWFSDQDTIQDIFLDFQNKIKFYNLESKYIDWYYSSDSFIWVGKGDNKHNNKKYIDKEKEIICLSNKN